MLTSYEIVWATARTLPIILYFLFLLQPAPKVPYTPTLLTAITKIIINFNSEDIEYNGMTYHRSIGTHMIKIDTQINKNLFLKLG